MNEILYRLIFSRHATLLFKACHLNRNLGHFLKSYRMKKTVLALLLSLGVISGNSQTAQDLFSSGSRITWLGIEYSHVRLIGNFSDFLIIRKSLDVISLSSKTKVFQSFENQFFDIMGSHKGFTP